MWTPIIKAVDWIDKNKRVTVAFENSVDATLNVIEQYFINSDNLDNLKHQIKSRLDSLVALENFNLALGTIDLTLPPKTQAEIDKETFLKDYTRWVSVKRAIDLGILTGSETKVTGLKNKILTELKPEYIDII